MKRSGKVYLVGGGPGDPGLLTLKAYDLLQKADVVVYDRLISKDILDLIAQGITRIPVGKESGHHCVPQDNINEMLVKLATSCRQVVRLKGGDPYVFGRGSEEALYLKKHGVDFEIVPGVTAAVACSAYAGVPLSHRGVSRKIELMTGHFQDDQVFELGDKSYADPQTTLVIYMGLANMDSLFCQLIRQGLDAETPAIAIQDGTLPTQRTVTATVSTLSNAVREAGLSSPVLLVIGRTVSLAEELEWFKLQELPENEQALVVSHH